MNTEQLKLALMDRIFFLQKMLGVDISVERDGFMVSHPQIHIHIRYNADIAWLAQDLKRIESFILDVHNRNENTFETVTHEQLKAKGMSQAEFLTSGGTKKRITSQATLQEYLDYINAIKK